jgi:flagellar export protein FliJ
MKPFSFRPQPALDLRRQQEESARRALALAEAELARADADLAEARARADRATDVRHAAFARGTHGHELEWHRNWMMGLEREVARADRRREERRTDVHAAERRVQDARRALRALERLRERLWRAYQQQARREEQRDLDLLASLQFAARKARPEEEQ